MDVSLSSRGLAGKDPGVFLSPKQKTQAAKAFFLKTIRACHTVTPRVITVDKNAAYPKALNDLKVEVHCLMKIFLDLSHNPLCSPFLSLAF